MRRIPTILRNNRPTPASDTTPSQVDHRMWGFQAVDGLPDLEAATPYLEGLRDYRQSRTPDEPASRGFDDELKVGLARIDQWVQEIEARRGDGRLAVLRHQLSTYEVEVCDAMTARRDAGLRLQQILADDVAGYEGGIATVQAGLVMQILAPAIGGTVRQNVNDGVAGFEAARHRFRLALVAVALDNGMSAVQIGEAFGFSRQLASRYLKEARVKWPELAEPCTGKARAG
jgi:hypothetical protein